MCDWNSGKTIRWSRRITKHSLAFLLPAGLLRESVLHRYAQYCNLVRECLLINYLYQSVNIRDLDSERRDTFIKDSFPFG